MNWNNATADELLAAGFGRWNGPADREDGKTLWLIPASMYDEIPDGIELVTINDKTILFEHGKTDNDRRFGCLAYGILR